MTESIEDLLNKKDGYQKDANDLKEKRNQLHLKSKKLADERDFLNSTIRDMRNKIAIGNIMKALISILFINLVYISCDISDIE